jgi:hypothetical protein
MAAESAASGGGDPPFMGSCKNAEQYAEERLNRADEPLRPSQMAEEYGCTPSRMRGALGTLRERGVVERVGRGEYALADGDSTTDESGGEDSPDAAEESPGTDGESPPLGDGLHLLPDTDGQDGDPEGDEGNVECPVSGCDFTAESLDSLQGHANASLDHNWEEIEEEVAGPEMEAEIVDVGDGEVTDESGGDSPGIPLPVSSTTLMVGVVGLVAVVAAWSYLRADGSASSSSASENQQQSEDDPADPFLDDDDLSLVEGDD